MRASCRGTRRSMHGCTRSSHQRERTGWGSTLRPSARACTYGRRWSGPVASRRTASTRTWPRAWQSPRAATGRASSDRRLSITGWWKICAVTGGSMCAGPAGRSMRRPQYARGDRSSAVWKRERSTSATATVWCSLARYSSLPRAFYLAGFRPPTWRSLRSRSRLPWGRRLQHAGSQAFLPRQSSFR